MVYVIEEIQNYKYNNDRLVNIMNSSGCQRSYLQLPHHPNSHSYRVYYPSTHLTDSQISIGSVTYPITSSPIPNKPRNQPARQVMLHNFKSQSHLEQSFHRSNPIHQIMRSPINTSCLNLPPYGRSSAKLDVVSPLSKQSNRPKISFSYNREEKDKVNLKVIGSCKVTPREELPLKIQIREFQLTNLKKSGLEKKSRLKICSSVHNHFQQPFKVIKNEEFMPEKSVSVQNPTKTSETSFNENSTTKQNYGFNKQSNMKSTEGTQSFFVSGSSTDFSTTLDALRSDHWKTYQQSAINSNFAATSFTQLTLMDRLSPSKDLKKTVFVNNYDFGGIFEENSQNDPSTCPKLVNNNEETNQIDERKWKSTVKCLFTNEQQGNMKESIHCSPDTRHQNFKCELLGGFGRDIAGSIIPSYD